jgi:hypothetical protein
MRALFCLILLYSFFLWVNDQKPIVRAAPCEEGDCFPIDYQHKRDRMITPCSPQTECPVDIGKEMTW